MNNNSQNIIEAATGEVKAVKAPAFLQCLALGSCVAVILYDEENKIGGIAHVMLPLSVQGSVKDEDSLKHADNAVRELIVQMRALGAKQSALVARLVGGALVIQDNSNIGQENIEAVRKVLGELSVRILDEHIGGNAGRSVLFNAGSGELQINGKTASLQKDDSQIFEQNKFIDSKSSKYIRELEKEVTERTKELDSRVEELESIRTATFNLLQDLEKEREELTKAKAKDEGMLASIADGLVVVDKDAQIILINRAAEAMTGFKSQEVLNKAWPEVILLAMEGGKPVPSQEDPVFLAVHSGTTTISNRVYEYTRKDKTKFPAAVTVSPVNVEGKLIGAVLVFRDVTREREVDKAKTEFVSLASHQLRTPLTSIKWYSEVLLAGTLGSFNEKQKKYLDEVYTGNQRIIRLVNTLLNVSRIELGTFMVEPALVNVAELAQSVAEEQKPQINEKRIEFSFSFEKKIPLLSADPQLLRMVMQNLLSNSVKYTPEEGVVKFSLSSDPKDIVIKVSDTGCGIPKHQQHQIFSKLFRADNVIEKDTDGTGLGLYIVKSITDIAGGKVWFESEENKGTAFYVSLPLEGMKKKEGVRALS